ncbi:MAG: hypothetical protein A2X86_00515 [Bdellovibrionales bacterium GWA2_49_15]|nr:MAG: hypothetical protein A2X86_00515 [Bdellovibrionales bacterium GWA2_49_15]HAZ13251.1 hypothetical protein [Bdellovibrionales bacterium]
MKTFLLAVILIACLLAYPVIMYFKIKEPKKRTRIVQYISIAIVLTMAVTWSYLKVTFGSGPWW